jgi:hypothetical protein
MAEFGSGLPVSGSWASGLQRSFGPQHSAPHLVSPALQHSQSSGTQVLLQHCSPAPQQPVPHQVQQPASPQTCSGAQHSPRQVTPSQHSSAIGVQVWLQHCSPPPQQVKPPQPSSQVVVPAGHSHPSPLVG